MTPTVACDLFDSIRLREDFKTTVHLHELYEAEVSTQYPKILDASESEMKEKDANHRGMGILPMHRRLSAFSESSFRQGRRWRNRPCEEIVISGAWARRPCHDGHRPAAANFL